MLTSACLFGRGLLEFIPGATRICICTTTTYIMTFAKSLVYGTTRISDLHYYITLMFALKTPVKNSLPTHPVLRDPSLVSALYSGRRT